MAAPLTDCLKQPSFVWTKEVADSFCLLKKLLTKAIILALPDFDKTFELDCDSSGVGIGGVMLNGQPIYSSLPFLCGINLESLTKLLMG